MVAAAVSARGRAIDNRPMPMVAQAIQKWTDAAFLVTRNLTMGNSVHFGDYRLSAGCDNRVSQQPQR